MRPFTSLQKILILVAGILVIVGVIFAVGIASRNDNDPQQFGSGGPFESVGYSAAIGSATAPATLTAAYTGASTTPMISRGLPNVVLAGRYTPASYGSTMSLRVERSIDNGVTYQPYSVLSYGTTSTQVYSDPTNGIPYVVGTPGTSASGTAIGFSFDLTLAADYIRVSALESTTSTAGVVYLQTQLSSN